jgi:hypothetical protein
LSTLTPKFAQQMGGAIDGIYSTGYAWSITDSSNPAIAQYLSELKAANQPSKTLDDSIVGVQGWASVHVIADALKGRAVTSKELVARLNTPGAVDTTKYAFPPIDYTKPAIPQIPELAKLRLFSAETSMWQFDASGAPKPLADGWLNVLTRMSIKPLG